MSTQSINKKNIENTYKEVQDSIIENTKKLVLQEGFALGEGMCEEEQKHNLKLYSIISKENCTLDDYLFQIITKGPDCEYKVDIDIIGDSDTAQPAEDLYQIWLMRGNTGDYNDFLDMLFNVNVDVWETNEW